VPASSSSTTTRKASSQSDQRLNRDGPQFLRVRLFHVKAVTCAGVAVNCDHSFVKLAAFADALPEMANATTAWSGGGEEGDTGAEARSWMIAQGKEERV